MIDETRARFLTSIATQLPVERVAEVHLFAAIRQGGMESGVAVLAVEQAIAPVAGDEPTAPPEHALEAMPERTVESVEVGESDTAANVESITDPSLEPNAAPGVEPNAEPVAATARAYEQQPALAATSAPTPMPRRYVVYTARYRHTLKGLDRGKWEVSVTEEADAPLLTVDAVVRGVQRRSGDVDDIVRLSGDEMRAILAEPVARSA